MEDKAKKKKGKELLDRLKLKYRLVVMNDANFEEKASLKLSPLNVFVVIGSLILFLITGTIYIIAFTPLREYIPGYADVNMRRNMQKLAVRADSLQDAMEAKDKYLQDIKNVISGNIHPDKSGNPKDTTNKYVGVNSKPSDNDMAFREEIEKQDKSYSLAVSDGGANKNDISSFFFFKPITGMVSNSFNNNFRHYGVDIAAQKNEAIKSVLDGTVIFSEWTVKTGHTIHIQHSNNLVSVYKHNSALLKKEGERVNAGEVIAIVGNSGEYTSGSHLHFELWYNGTPVNPQDYINF